MSLPLSQAILKGAPLTDGFADSPYNDPLGAAYLGSLKPESLPHFWEYVQGADDRTLCKFMVHKLHTKWPHLGQSVRAWPRLAEELERDRLIPQVKVNQSEYRQEIHCSLWKAITDLHDLGESKGQIAARLWRYGL